jgi:hypothetical protein
MERVERMHSAHAACTKELDCEAIDTTVHADFAAEFALAVGEYTPAFESYEFLKEHVTLGFLPL